MRGFAKFVQQLFVAALVIGGVSGLIGLLVAVFAGLGGAVGGFAYGMIAGGSIVGFATGSSGSPAENLVRGRAGAFGTYWGEGSPLPQSPLQFALGSLLAFAAGVALLVLFVY